MNQDEFKEYADTIVKSVTGLIQDVGERARSNRWKEEQKKIGQLIDDIIQGQEVKENEKEISGVFML